MSSLISCLKDSMVTDNLVVFTVNGMVCQVPEKYGNYRNL